jgi:hypothetical protein
LGSSSWPEQVAKYVALIIWEEAFSRPRENLGLLFIVPEGAISGHWGDVGLAGPEIDVEFAARIDPSRLPKKIRALFEAKPDQVRSVLGRLRLSVISWRHFRADIFAIESRLDSRHAGDQTLKRLLAGFRDQIERHDNTDVGKPIGNGELFTVVDGKVTDRDLHGEILGDDNHADVSETGREQAKKAGLIEQELTVLFGPSRAKPS